MSNCPNVEIISPKNLYKWASVWGKIQKNYYEEPVHLRREKQIEDFILLNEFKNVYVEKDTDIFKNLISVESPEVADLVLITNQQFSRLPCVEIINKIQELIDKCPKLFICLNRHYINIDNAYQDPLLSEHFPLAITQWLKKNLKGVKIIDMSLDYVDCGDYFTWVIPDRIYYIEKL
jgi:hypothetical protein